MEVPKKRRPHAGDGIDEAEKCGSDSKKHKKNNGDGFSEDETMRMHDNHCDGRRQMIASKRGHGVTMSIKIHREQLVGFLPLDLIPNLMSFLRMLPRNKPVKRHRQIRRLQDTAEDDPMTESRDTDA
ncbi:hypothetical protein Bca52824_002123 [Brassica carinata]|uniref:Uncharacterized protein n=1 Tax=Brassica carinata TaxID=52824 RepID=A0A8X7WMT9_BRACI|nr:hypothetical protein Bca52824_002123 [Brassica carinata]